MTDDRAEKLRAAFPHIPNAENQLYSVLAANAVTVEQQKLMVTCVVADALTAKMPPAEALAHLLQKMQYIPGGPLEIICKKAVAEILLVSIKQMQADGTLPVGTMITAGPGHA